MKPTFTAHNIRLDDGSYTIDAGASDIAQNPWLLGALRAMSLLNPASRAECSVVDLGCLEGGYTVEFARAGYDACGLEVRETNIEACNYARERVDLPNLRFVQDDARNVHKHGPFDVTFCSGLLYHLDRPLEFLRMVAGQTNRMLILQTHFAPQHEGKRTGARRLFANVKRGLAGREKSSGLRYGLSPMTENEGLPGRWFSEFSPGQGNDQNNRWASWNNERSFWLTRPALLQSIKDVGFDLVFEQFDNLSPSIQESMTSGYYAESYRSTFVGVKVADAP